MLAVGFCGCFGFHYISGWCLVMICVSHSAAEALSCRCGTSFHDLGLAEVDWVTVWLRNFYICNLAWLCGSRPAGDIIIFPGSFVTA